MSEPKERAVLPQNPALAPKKSGAYIHAGPREYQLYADLGDHVTLVLEVDPDCPGRVFTYVMDGGIVDSALTVKQFRMAGLAMQELLEKAFELWPGKMRETPE